MMAYELSTIFFWKKILWYFLSMDKKFDRFYNALSVFLTSYNQENDFDFYFFFSKFDFQVQKHCKENFELEVLFRNSRNISFTFFLEKSVSQMLSLLLKPSKKFHLIGSKLWTNNLKVKCLFENCSEHFLIFGRDLSQEL